MNTDVLFESNEEMEATERVLGSIKGQKLNENMDVLVSEILGYAKEIDDLLVENGYEASYLDLVSNISNIDEVKLYVDIESDTIRERIEDLIKRINTRIALLKNSNNELNELTNLYNLDNIDIACEIEKANLV